jgi:hypothetical protein
VVLLLVFFQEMHMTVITRQIIEEDHRVTHTDKLFGFHFPLHLEPLVYAMADRLSKDYKGGYWEFYALSNGGFYMAPSAGARFHVTCENGFEGDLTADALGITACLYAYSQLSFSGMLIADFCAEQYHRLREYALEHPEAGAVMAAID